MPFHEKSAWIMSVALLLGGVFYFGVVTNISAQTGVLAPPFLPLVVAYTALLVLVAIVGHVVIAILAPKDATAPLDEREKTIRVRAGDFSRYVLGAGALLGLGVYLISYDGNLLFYSVFASLMLAQLVEYLTQIVLYRSAL